MNQRWLMGLMVAAIVALTAQTFVMVERSQVDGWEGPQTTKYLSAKDQIRSNSELEKLSHTGTETSITSALRKHRATVLVTSEDVGVTLDRAKLRCHGGVALISWHLGNLEPRTPDIGIQLTMQLDGQDIATIAKGGNMGVWEDGPVDMMTAARCRKGTHTLTTIISALAGEGAWGAPYVANLGQSRDHSTVQSGFIVTEVY